MLPSHDSNLEFHQLLPPVLNPPWRRAARVAQQKPLAAAGALMVLAVIVVAIIGPTVAPFGYDEADPISRLQGPSASHWFGTDDQGRDQFSRVLYGARPSVIVAFVATLLATAGGTALGLVSGYFGGKTDIALQRVLEIWQAFPGFVFVVFIVSILGPSLVNVIITIALLFVANTSRLIRSAAISIRSQTYIESTRSIGATNLRIILLHILPNILPIIIVSASVQLGAVIIVESSLSFVGFGVPPPRPTWGGMLQEGQRFMRQFPHLAFFPGAAIALVVYSLNVLGDGVRDVLDPRLRGSR